MNTTLSNLPDSWIEADELISILRAWGINYLVGLHGSQAQRVEHNLRRQHRTIERVR